MQDDFGKMQLCYALFVVCSNAFVDIYEEKYLYCVQALCYDCSFPLFIDGFFNTPSEAFGFAERIREKYPKYNDERDHYIEYSPVFDMNLFKEPRPSSATK